MDYADTYNHILERLITHAREGTTDSAEGITRMPADYYLDPDIWQREVDNIFKRLPLLLGFTSELRDSGQYKAVKIMGVPVIMIRSKDGRVRAFLNACRHRGAAVLKEGTGKCARMVCPYHAWAYNDRGVLVTVNDAPKFGDLDTEGEGLTELPCAERAGLIFVGLTPGYETDIDAYLGGMLPELESLEIAHWELCATQSLTTANWKMAHDGYVDGYHIASLHPTTIGAFSQSNVLTFDAWGPHQRIGFAHHNILDVAEQAPADRTLNDGLTVIRTVFPNISLAVQHGSGGLISQLYPGPEPGTSITIQNFLAPKKPETPEEEQMLKMQTDMLYAVVRDEDYATVDTVQEGLQSGAIPDVLFGKSELGNQRLHDWIAHYSEDQPDPANRPNP